MRYGKAAYNVHITVTTIDGEILFLADDLVKHLGLESLKSYDVEDDDLIVDRGRQIINYVTLCGAVQLINNEDSHKEIGKLLLPLVVSTYKKMQRELRAYVATSTSTPEVPPLPSDA